MNWLSGELAEHGGNKHQPGEQFRSVGWRAQEVPGLLGEVDEDGCRVEYAGLFAPRPLGVDNRRHLAIWVDGAETRRVLFALAGVDGNRLVGEVRFFEEQGDLRRVRGRGEKEADHRALPSRDWLTEC